MNESHHIARVTPMHKPVRQIPWLHKLNKKVQTATSQPQLLIKYQICYEYEEEEKKGKEPMYSEAGG